MGLRTWEYLVSSMIPAERLGAIRLLAEASKTHNVMTVVESHRVRRQYEQGVAARGGNLGRLYIVVQRRVYVCGVDVGDR